MTWEERGTIIYLYNGILNGIQVRLLPETLKREAGVNPAQCRCCIGGAVLIGHWGYALGRREPRWMPESEVQFFCFVDPETTSLCDLAQAWAVSASTAHAAPARRMIGAFLHADAMQWKKVVLT